MATVGNDLFWCCSEVVFVSLPLAVRSRTVFVTGGPLSDVSPLSTDNGFSAFSWEVVPRSSPTKVLNTPNVSAAHCCLLQWYGLQGVGEGLNG